MQYLIIVIIAFSVMMSGMLVNTAKLKKNLSVSSKPGVGKFGPYCLSRDELDAIIQGPTAFSCEGREYVLAAEDVLVDKIFIHAEKKLIIKKTCDGTPYYSWFCHPPLYGSLWNNTLWKLKPDPSGTIKDNDLFDVYIVKDPDANAEFICRDPATSMTGVSYSSLAAAGEEIPIIDVNNAQAEWVMSSETTTILDIENAPVRRKIMTIPLRYSSGEVKEFDVWVNLLKAFSPDEGTMVYLVEKGVLPSTNVNIPNPLAYKKYQIRLILPTASDKNSLQLGTFKPVIPTPPNWLKIYLPESKPVIYLYPEQKSLIHVEANPIDGKITVSDPQYPVTGWDVIADKNSAIQVNNATYPYLYYETEVAGYGIPKEGFVFETKNIGEKLSKIVSDLGLNEKETQEFTSYWVERFDKEVKTKYLFVGVISKDEMDRVVPLKILPEPKSIIRVRLYFRPEEKLLNVTAPILSGIPGREGFTAVEWGGILVK